ncbi:hypothetical protein FA13DRAFT_1791460 [Coprinellus micaceus]|uniref:Transmembrane protein n=1 Tax=Coprinellus micaceus TaxID=71717 RepID=A0A4Y7TCL9_COPMI|nr:hypothetical protein FA13DRAFT_1791460 [Coprinellus micaceus]
MAPQVKDCIFVGLLMSFFSFGLYTVVFGLYVKLVMNRKSSGLKGLDWAIGSLFLVTGVTVILDSIQEFHNLRRGESRKAVPWLSAVNTTTSVTMVTLDFVAQLVLIYRCWVVWNKNVWVAIPPVLIAVASAACGLAASISIGVTTGDDLAWWVSAGSSWTILSLIANGVVSGLMIKRIYSIHQATKGVLFHSGRLDLAWVTTMLIESAVVLFVGQLVFVVLYRMNHPGWFIIALPVTCLYGICCTAIMVCVSEKKPDNTSTTHEAMPSVVVHVLSTRSHGGESVHDEPYTEGSSSSTRRLKGPNRDKTVGFEFNSMYSNRSQQFKTA